MVQVRQTINRDNFEFSFTFLFQTLELTQSFAKVVQSYLNLQS